MSDTREKLTTNLFLLEDLADASRTRELAEGDLDALRAVADWIKTFVISPHKDLGRAGPVCPFTPGALERNTLWLAPEQIADRSVPEVVELISRYQRLFEDAQPTDGDDTIYKSFVVVFTDVSPDQAKKILGDVLDHLAVPSYVKDGFVMGPFYEGNEGTAIYNASFHPFTSPVPFLLVRQAVVTDWKSSWTTRSGSTCGHVATEPREPRRLLMISAACRGARSATDRRRVSTLTRTGNEMSLAGQRDDAGWQPGVARPQMAVRGSFRQSARSARFDPWRRSSDHPDPDNGPQSGAQQDSEVDWFQPAKVAHLSTGPDSDRRG